MKLVAFGAVPVMMFGSLIGLVVLVSPPAPAGADVFCLPEGASSTPADQFDREQMANAAAIIEIGRSRNVPPRGWLVALSAALQESSLRNLPSGDRDSAGLFQMRPSQGWGTWEQVTDPKYTATAFFGGADVAPDNPGLLDIEGWDGLSVAEAAQAVERSADPNAYARWEDEAAGLIKAITGEDFDCSDASAGLCRRTGLPVENGLTPDAVRVVRCGVELFHFDNIGGLATSGHVSGSDHYTGRAVDLMVDDWQTEAGVRRGDRAASYFVQHADAFGITYIIWRARIWSTDHPSWRTYSHPQGRTDSTAMHMDHLHISVSGEASINPKKETAS